MTACLLSVPNPTLLILPAELIILASYSSIISIIASDAMSENTTEEFWIERSLTSEFCLVSYLVFFYFWIQRLSVESRVLGEGTLAGATLMGIVVALWMEVDWEREWRDEEMLF